MNHQIWTDKLLAAVAGLGMEGRTAADFLQRQGIRIGFFKAGAHVGAFWTPVGLICLNAYYYSYQTPLEDLRLKTLIIHEAWHLQQGPVLALSVYGELEAWQREFRVFHRVQGRYPHDAIAELVELPLTFERPVLQHAARLMQTYASSKYRSDLLPLYPLGQELKYQLLRK